MTLAGNFRHALIREYVLACGLRCASRRACTSVLKSGPGNSIVLTVGGAAESLLIEPGGCRQCACRALAAPQCSCAAGPAPRRTRAECRPPQPCA
jgi:hypothetical protein